MPISPLSPRASLHLFAAGGALLLASQPAGGAPLGGPGDHEKQYEVGGSLAGVKLPLFPSQFGAPAGRPGAIPENVTAAKAGEEDNTNSSQAKVDYPEYQLYPGSVEHWRAYWMRHVGSRSLWDAQTLVKNFVAAGLPGVPAPSVEQYASPIYHLSAYGSATATGHFAAPVSVVRLLPSNPVLKLDLGDLHPGMYAVRVIGATETAKLRGFRLPQYLTLRVNDGLGGEQSTYRMRVSAVDEFYSVAEIYFHAPQTRHYEAELLLDSGSTCDLLVHNVTLDDVLAGETQRAIKTRMTMHTPQDLAPLATEPPQDVKAASEILRRLTPEQRMERDANIWAALPPLNTVGSWVNYHGPSVSTYFEAGSADRTGAQIEASSGKWEAAPGSLGSHPFFPTDAAAQSAFLINGKLGLRYSIGDLWTRKPLPDPYPFKDEGSGLFFPDAVKPDSGRVLAPIADAIGTRLYNYHHSIIDPGTSNWRMTGNDAFRRDAAVALVRIAYQFPAYDTANYLTPVALNPGPYGRDLRFRQREENSRWFDNGDPYSYTELVHDYDLLFPYIQGNEELARSISRFVPWVKNSSDVIRLMDVYLVQYEAKLILRYHDFTLPTAIAETAAALGDRSVTDPWMEWLFTKTYKYPLKPLGLQDMLINGYDRDGAEVRGSTYYARTGGHSSDSTAAEMDAYMAAGGNPRYNVRDPKRFPKPLAQTHWELALILAGAEYPRVGDVTGPDKQLGLRQSWTGSLEEASRLGWRWSKESKFAWILSNFFGRKSESDAEWAAITAAAHQSGLRRAPWLDNPSRVISNWAGILETGLQHDDFRFRRASYLRVGIGFGHQHDDTLDLQIVAHGLPMTVDPGQRTGYSTPDDEMTRVHNTVEVDGKNLRTQSWVGALTDTGGARYLRANAAPWEGTALYERQLALIDVDEGRGSRLLSVAEQRPDAVLPSGVTTPNSYTFDVFRIAGGQQHTYCFHTTTEDDFQWNADRVLPVPHLEKAEGKDLEADYLVPFQLSGPTKQAGDAPAAGEPLQATWRWPRTGTGSEASMLMQNYDANAPRQFVRLHLFNAGDARALKADMVCQKWNYRFTNLMVQRHSTGKTDLQSAFAAVIEPYAGEPFIVASKALPVEKNETDAKRVVAVEVRTRNGHRDVLLADGRPDKVRTVGGIQFAGEYGVYSSDGNGLRLATLSGGTQLSTPTVRLFLPARARAARVVAADYENKTLRIDQPWPRSARGLFEVGVPGHRTSYSATSVASVSGGSLLQLDHGADYFRSAVVEVDGASGVVTCRDETPLGSLNGLTDGWVASDEARTHLWRANYLGAGKFKLTGAPVSRNAFGPSGIIRLWECGVGDTVRQNLSAAVHRVGPGIFSVAANAAVTVGLPSSGILLSRDGKTWSAPHQVAHAAGWTTVGIPADAALKGPLYLKTLP